MTTAKKSVNYIANKTSARKKRLDRIQWIDSTVSRLTAEKNELLSQVNRDNRAIEDLTKFTNRKEELLVSVPEMERQLLHETGDTARKILERLLLDREELAGIDDKIKKVYYA